MSKRLDRSIRVSPRFFAALTQLMERGISSVVVTVVESRGSAPGKAGGKMIVTADATQGTVGGGRVEQAAIQHARTLLDAPGPPETHHYDVIRDLGMTCGGSMTLLYERHGPPPRLIVFGAGHVSHALCSMAAVLGMDVVVCDPREDWLTQERFPAVSQRIVAPVTEALEHVRIDAGSFVVSVAPQHAVDVDVVRGILAGETRPRYLGVIGSQRKAVEFRKELLEGGVSAQDADWIRIPVGLNIGASDPAEIAVSILAELVAELRGAETGPSW